MDKNKVTVMSSSICGGKTTIMDAIELLQKANKFPNNYVVIDERVDFCKEQLMRYNENRTFETFIELQEKFYELFELITGEITEFINNDKHVIVGRSPSEVMIFNKNSNLLIKQDLPNKLTHPNQYRLFKNYRKKRYEKLVCKVSELEKNSLWCDAHYIYLHVDYALCHKRCIERASLFDNKLPIEYFENLENLYKEWIGTRKNITKFNYTTDNDLVKEPLYYNNDTLLSMDPIRFDKYGETILHKLISIFD